MYINGYSVYNTNLRKSFGSSLAKTVTSPTVQKELSKVSEKFDTEKTLNKVLFEMATQSKLTQEIVSKLESFNKIGKISKEINDVLDDICFLHKRLNTTLVFMTDSEIYKLKKEYPNFKNFKPYTSITVNNVNNSGLGITLYNNLINESNNDLKTICIRSKNSDVIDLIPIKGDKVYKTRDISGIKKTANPLNYIIKDEFLTEDKVDLNKISKVLNALKNELTNIFELTSDGGGIINEDLGDLLALSESKISTIKKQIAIKKLRPKSFTLYPNGAIEFNNINEKGDKLYWLPAQKNKKLLNTTVIKLLSSEDKLLDGIAINDDRVLSNYPAEHKDNYPQVLKFYTSDEMKKLCIDERLKRLIEYFEVGNKRFNKDLDDMVNFRKKISQIF